MAKKNKAAKVEFKEWKGKASTEQDLRSDLLLLKGAVAMAAKVGSHPWSIEELYEKVMATVEA